MNCLHLGDRHGLGVADDVADFLHRKGGGVANEVGENDHLALVLALDHHRQRALRIFVETRRRQLDVSAAEDRHVLGDERVGLGEDRAPRRPAPGRGAGFDQRGDVHHALHRHARHAHKRQIDDEFPDRREGNGATAHPRLIASNR